MKASSDGTPRQPIIIERTFDGAIEDVWDLWTTKEGIESWWGPDGFRVEVRSIDLRPGGEMRYAMIAVDPEMVAFMKQSGMPTTHEVMIRFREIVPRRRLRFTNLADFVPGVKPYEVETIVELKPTADGVHLMLVLEPMHDAEWTDRAATGWRQELGKMEKVLVSRRIHGGA